MDVPADLPAMAPRFAPADLPAAPLRHPSASYHATLLSISAAIMAAALLLRVRPDQRVELMFLPGWPAPDLCQSRALFGWECPGCGLTRSFVHLAHGDVSASIGVHRVGWLWALGVLLQIPYRIWAIRADDGAPLGTRFPWIVAISLVALLIVDWMTRLVAAAI
jgi:hypothetical protein